MRQWQLQEAKARFSEFLDSCLKEGPQLVTKRGAAAAVLVPVDEWQRLQERQRRSLKEILLGDGPRFDIPTPPRNRYRRRPPVTFD
ncbi:MAG TPA: type II toxin-antitoxin system Phd/YefM family antitoxin [Stellaceae bacterium]|jgi:prevent-host-death family protein|nr:type II toxin-antitoxin system Phd/YefM family antitoxin [Stellaceae bacterium]